MQSFVQRNRIVILHASFWCAYISFFVYQISSRSNEPDWARILTIVFIQVLFAGLISYLNYFLLVPRFLMRKKITLFIVIFLLAFSLLILTRFAVERYVLDFFDWEGRYLYRARFIVQVLTSNLFIVIFVGLLRFVTDWIELESKRKEIEKERLTAELNFLRAQINPHFLFNTLNNLYYLAYSKSDNTTIVIEKLSQMMRYMIYESNHPKVLLNKEIEYMKNYVSLEQLRLNNQVPIRFDIEGNTNDIWITPLIFITFLENAFKHGVNNHSTDSWVNVSIKLSGNECTYAVENSKLPPAHDTKEGKSGIGLQNVQRRLELSYPGQFELKIDDQPDRYSVQLHINLI